MKSRRVSSTRFCETIGDVVENGGKHPCGSTCLLYLSRDKVGRGMRSSETKYKETNVRAALNLYQNRDQAMKMVRDFEERAESVGQHALTMEAVAYAKEYGLQLPMVVTYRYKGVH